MRPHFTGAAAPAPPRPNGSFDGATTRQRQPLGVAKAEIARLLRVSRQTLYDIIEEKQAITPAMALRLGKLCGNWPDLWINMQRDFDLKIAVQELADEIEQIPTPAGAE